MESHSDLGTFFVPPPFPPFSNEAEFEIQEQNKSKEVLELETYFMNTFNLELESGRNNRKLFDNDDINNFICKKTETVNDLYDESEGAIYNNLENHQPQTNKYSNYNMDDFVNMGYEESDANSNEFEPYKDDAELIIEELTNIEENETSNIFTDDFLSNITNETLPPIEMAFPTCNYTHRDNSNTQDEVVFNNLSDPNESGLVIDNLDRYSYPNNLLNCINNSVYLPDTPVSSCEFTFDDVKRRPSIAESNDYNTYYSGRSYSTSESIDNYYDRRKYSITESIESDIPSIIDDIGDDDLFVSLDDLGLQMEEEDYEVPIKKFKKSLSDTESTEYSGEMICKWQECYQSYPNQTSLVEHIERTHVNTYKGDEYCCYWNECLRSRRPFNARYKLLIHMRVHSGHKPNKCTFPGCNKAFSRLENLKIHVRSHTGERPYPCPAPHCHKAFSNSSDRAKHSRTHYDARPYACQAPNCNKRYTDPSSLRKHVKSHPQTHKDVSTSYKIDKTVYIAQQYSVGIKRSRGGRSNFVTSQSPVKKNTIDSIRNKINIL